MYISSISSRIVFKDCFGLFCCCSLTVYLFKDITAHLSLTDSSGCIFSVIMLCLNSIKLGNHQILGKNAFVYILVMMG